jgi:hypothetical protein
MNPNEEQLKQAYALISAARQHGFITHLHAMGKSANEIAHLHDRYVPDSVARDQYLHGLREAISGGK